MPAEPPLDLGNRQALDLEDLLAARLSSRDPHGRARNPQPLRDELDASLVRPAFQRRRCYRKLPLLAFFSDDLSHDGVPRSAWLHFHRKPDDRRIRLPLNSLRQAPSPWIAGAKLVRRRPVFFPSTPTGILPADAGPPRPPCPAARPREMQRRRRASRGCARRRAASPL